MQIRRVETIWQQIVSCNFGKLCELCLNRPYLPCFVTGINYTLIAIHNINLLSLDYGLLTTMSLLSGVAKNTLTIILVAIIYERTKNKASFAVYLLTYLFTNILNIVDAFYFQITSTHIESVAFDNLNIYSIKGILGSNSGLYGLGFLSVIILMVYSFFRYVKVDVPRKNRIRTVILICLTVWLCNSSAIFLNNTIQKYRMDLEMALEATNQEYRALLAEFGLREFTVAKYINRNELNNSIYIETVLEGNRQECRAQIEQFGVGNFFVQLLKHYNKSTMVRKNDNKPLTVSKEEAGALDSMGLLIRNRYEQKPQKSNFDRIVVVVLESTPRDYLHYYNPSIPLEATKFFDNLLTQYPKVNKYYTSNMPTEEGLFATLNSRICLDESESSVFSILKENGYKTYFIEAASKLFGNLGTTWPKMYKMDTLLTGESLQQRYSGASGWGFHDDVLYKETIRLLKENRKNKVIVVTNSVDMHQPLAYCGIPDEELPQPIRNSAYQTIKGLYWLDRSLEKFFLDLQSEGLFDENTLIVVTSDHNPQPGGEFKKLVKGDGSARLAPIPMVFVTKSSKFKIDETGYSSQIDFAPTLLSIVGIPPCRDFMGRDLTATRTGKDFALGMYYTKIYYRSHDLFLIADFQKDISSKNVKKRAFSKWINNNINI